MNQGKFKTHTIKMGRRTGKVHLQHAKADPIQFLINSGTATGDKSSAATGSYPPGIGSRKKNKNKNRKNGRVMKVFDEVTGEEHVALKDESNKEWSIVK